MSMSSNTITNAMTSLANFGDVIVITLSWQILVGQLESIPWGSIHSLGGT